MEYSSTVLHGDSQLEKTSQDETFFPKIWVSKSKIRKLVTSYLEVPLYF